MVEAKPIINAPTALSSMLTADRRRLQRKDKQRGNEDHQHPRQFAGKFQEGALKTAQVKTKIDEIIKYRIINAGPNPDGKGDGCE